MNKKKVTAGAAACALIVSTVPGAYIYAEEFQVEYETYAEDPIDQQAGTEWADNTAVSDDGQVSTEWVDNTVVPDDGQVSTEWVDDTSVPDDGQTGTEWNGDTSGTNDWQGDTGSWDGSTYYPDNTQGSTESWDGSTYYPDNTQGSTESWDGSTYYPDNTQSSTGSWDGNTYYQEEQQTGVEIWEEEYTADVEILDEEMGTIFRKSEERLLPEDYEIPGKEEAEQAFQISSLSEIPEKVSLEVPEILQKPLLPTGCESVSLTMALQYEGFDVGKAVVAEDYLIYNNETDNMAIGYVGDPFSEEGAGCFAPAIAMTAQEFFLDQEAEYDAYDVTDSELDELFQYVAMETPVIIWTTMYMAEPEFTREDCEYNGRTYQWYRQEHCVVLSGYDLQEGTVQINDPLEGIVTRDMEEFERIFVKTGRNAVVLKEREENADEEVKVYESESAYEEETEGEQDIVYDEEMSLQEMWLAEQAALESEKAGNTVN